MAADVLEQKGRDPRGSLEERVPAAPCLPGRLPGWAAEPGDTSGERGARLLSAGFMPSPHTRHTCHTCCLPARPHQEQAVWAPVGTTCGSGRASANTRVARPHCGNDSAGQGQAPECGTFSLTTRTRPWAAPPQGILKRLRGWSGPGRHQGLQNTARPGHTCSAGLPGPRELGGRLLGGELYPLQIPVEPQYLGSDPTWEQGHCR